MNLGGGTLWLTVTDAGTAPILSHPTLASRLASSGTGHSGGCTAASQLELNVTTVSRQTVRKQIRQLDSHT